MNDTKNKNVNELLKLIEENPDLPIIPMVATEVVAADDYAWWIGEWGKCIITEYYEGRETIHFKDEDEEDVLSDLKGCRPYCDKNGNDIYELPEEEWDRLYSSIPWIKCIAVYITI